MSDKKDDEKDEEEPEWCIWTDPLETLFYIEDCFKLDKNGKLHNKKILDVGTDCVKPLYMALKYEPDKIVGINEDFWIYPFESSLKQKLKPFVETEIQFHECSFFDEQQLKVLEIDKEGDKFDYILLSKTLHHLRTGKKCVADKRDKKHKCRDDDKCCIYEFKEKEIFERLFELGKRVIVYECYLPDRKDNDKVRGRGGYFTIKEWIQIFTYLLNNYNVKLIRPAKYHPNPKYLKKELCKIETKLRKVDCVCFYVEKTKQNLEQRK